MVTGNLFGDAVFHEDWMSLAQCLRLVGLGRWATDCTHGAAVEVGCWEGRSTIALARGLAPHTLHAVDHWRGDADDPRGWGISPQLAAARDVYGQFCANLALAGVHNVVIHKLGWQAYFSSADAPTAIRLLHLDGAHDYASVHDTIVVALPRMVPGGVICGDDANQPDVARAVRDTLGSVAQVELGVGLKLWWAITEGTRVTSMGGTGR